MTMQLSPQEPLFLAVKLAQERGLLPTQMSSAELQDFTLRLKERLFFSARTTNLWYVDKLKGLVERYTTGEGRDNDLAQLRIEARKLLVQAGYTPDAGFPGDAALGIPKATAGSLRDLSSEKRLNLIYETQAQTMRGLGMKLRGMSRMESQPAWELVRYKQAREKEWERDWMKRWAIAGENVEWHGALRDRMIALQTSPIWLALGSSALFADALNVDHPPFAFSSGMGWRAVGFRECEKLGLTKPPAEETETEIRAMIRAYMDRPFYDLEKDLKRRGMKVPDALKSTFKPKPIGPDSADTARLARLQLLRTKFDQITAERAKRALLAAPAASLDDGTTGKPPRVRGLAALLTPPKPKALDDVLSALRIKDSMTGVQAEKLIAMLKGKGPVKMDVLQSVTVRMNAQGEEARVALAKKLGVDLSEVTSEEFIRSTVEEFLSFVPPSVVEKLPKFKIDANDTLPKGIPAQYCSFMRVLSLDFERSGDPKSARKSLYHELTHWLHLHLPADDPWIKELNAHWKGRTAGETEQVLTNPAFDSVEYSGLRDHWYDRYMGRVYGHMNEATHGGLEVPTMIMENLARPDVLAAMWNHSAYARDDIRKVLSILFR